MYNREESIRQIDEALEAGERALAALNSAETALGSARGFGMWDMLGGNLLSGMLKHSKLDKAQDFIEEAEYQLKLFQKELRDVNSISCNIHVKFDGFSKGADYFFDNIFVDAMIQSKIKDSCEQVSKLKSEVQNAMTRLREMRRYEAENDILG